MVTCLCINVRAINETSPKPEARDVSETVIGRATNSFNMSNRFPVCRTIEVRQSDYHSFAGVLEDA